MQYGIKEMARGATNPLEGHWNMLKKVVRYVMETKDWCLTLQLGADERLPGLRAESDANWATGADRKSTSGTVVFAGETLDSCWLLHSHSRTQPVIALSSGESELIAAVGTRTEMIHARRIFGEMQTPVRLTAHLDSTAAIGAIARLGRGRMKHIDIRHLWLQQHVRDKSITILMLGTADHRADLFTKFLPAESHLKHSRNLGMCSVSEIFTSSEGVNFLGMIAEGEPDEEPSGESPSNIGGEHGYEAIEPPIGAHYYVGSDGELIGIACSSDEGDEAQEYHEQMMSGPHPEEYSFPEATDEEIADYIRSLQPTTPEIVASIRFGEEHDRLMRESQTRVAVRAQSVRRLSSEPQLGISLKPRWVR